VPRKHWASELLRVDRRKVDTLRTVIHNERKSSRGGDVTKRTILGVTASQAPSSAPTTVGSVGGLSHGGILRKAQSVGLQSESKCNGKASLHKTSNT